MKETDKTDTKDEEISITLHESPVQKPSESDKNDECKKESGGYENTAEPTRYSDWEIAGRCIDF